MSPDKDQEFFCDGITDEIINALVKVENLKVVARTSTFEFKTRSQDIREIASQLKVTTVLEGSVRKSGDRLRITAQLNDAASGFHLWSGTFDRDKREIFQIQEEIAQAIVDVLRVKLALNRPAPLVKAYTGDIETYTLYLKGLQQFNSPIPEGYRLAIDYFERAIARDPAYAPAYAGLAEAYYWLSRRYDQVPKDGMAKAKQAALKALQIDDSLAEAHASLAIFADYEGDHAAAEKEFKRSLELGPNSVSVHQSYALHLRPVSLDDALREMLRAQELDPLSSTIGQELIRIYIERREFDRAIEHARRLVARDPSFYIGYTSIGMALGGKGMHKESIAAHRQAHELNRRDPRSTASLGYELGVAGEKAEAAKLLDELEHASKQGHYVAPIFPAVIAAGMGNPDAVFHWLEKGYDDHIFQLSGVPNDYRFDGIRSDPRYVPFIKKLGFAK
jgi:TolB-like protein/Tfp pilus assembly protein PilF